MIKPGNPWWEASSFGNIWNIFWRLNIISVLKGIKNCPRISKWTKLTPPVYSRLLLSPEYVLLHSWTDFIMCHLTMQNIFDVSINKRTHHHHHHWLDSPWWAVAFLRSFAHSSLLRATFFQFLTSSILISWSTPSSHHNFSLPTLLIPWTNSQVL
jgi:hypothetical protein